MITATYKGKYYNVEYSVVNVSELEGELRIDAEYYEPFYIKILSQIKSKNNNNLLWKFIIKFEAGKNLPQTLKGIPFVRTQNVRQILIEKEGLSYVQKSKQKLKLLKKGDLLFVRVGAGVGVSSIVNKEFENATFSDNVIRVRLKEVNPFYIGVFLNTNIGRKYFSHVFKGTARPLISKENFQNLRIPIPSNPFQKFIEKLVLKAYEERQKAEQLYKQAEEILLEELGLKNWKPKTKKIKIGRVEFEEEENISIRMLSEVIKADRMDAEYWEPKYDEIEELIKNYKNGYSMVREEFLHKTDKLKIDKDDFYNYVEISSVNTSIGDFIPSYIKGKKLPANAKLRLEKGNLIVSKVRTYRKGVALIHKIYPNLIGSSAFVVLHGREDSKVNIETLFVFLRTDIFSMWSYKFYTGTSYPTLTDEDILNLLIPLINSQIQQKISQLIQQSFKAREISKKLLEIAKKTVEIYIEKDEEEGLEYAENELKFTKVF